MYLQAIKIKETILDLDDMEVAVALVDLADLYLYDLKKYSEAKQYYLRLIQMCK